MDRRQRQTYAKAIDTLLSDPKMRMQMREDALGVLDTLNIDIAEGTEARVSRDLGFTTTGGVAVPAIPLVAVAVVVASQIRDTPSEPEDDDDGGTSGGGDTDD